MKPASLSMRLGLTVSVLGALLVVVLAILAFLALTHELDALAKGTWKRKMQQIRHSLALEQRAGDLSLKPHSLLDQVMGHDNLNLTILDQGDPTAPLLSVGSPLPYRRRLVVRWPRRARAKVSYFSRSDDQGRHFLTATQLMPLNDGQSVVVLLSIDRSSDEALLSAYLSSTLIALPLLLILIGLSAWAVVQRGLARCVSFAKSRRWFRPRT